MAVTKSRLDLFSFRGNVRVLHLTWFAFFLSFVVWFNHAPLLAAIRDSLSLSDQQVMTLLILNVAVTIPARIIVGMLVDKLGPRRTYAILLISSGFLCFFFALAQSYPMLALGRFLLGFTGAGFVIGVRMIGEWFPAKQVGLAEGIYAGWGNFGAAAGAMVLPTLALAFGGEHGWRYAIALTGAAILVYAFVYYASVRDAPEGSTYFRPNKSGGLEVTSKGDLLLYVLMNIPLFAALAVLVWKLATLDLLTFAIAGVIDGLLAALFCYQVYHIFKVNAGIFVRPVPELYRYKFKQVAILNLAYMVTFGSELAVVSMLPLFIMDTFHASQVAAGLLAAPFSLIVVFARPYGGLLSDRVGRKKTLLMVLAGLTLGYLLLSQMSSSWPLPLAVGALVGCGLFVHFGTGAVFAMVPLIQRRLTGQIAGMTGAYGNVGGVAFLTVLSFASPQVFFLAIAGTALAVLVAISFLEEPKGAMAEILPDGTVQLIEVE
ncbi:MAG: NarK family nitrate/nitrite MFS transporter [Gammaproteobacteria bacterium]|nr:NarK family nitrate/nitrite MFS transporter [Gammaproteobacteria bacterium]